MLVMDKKEAKKADSKPSKTNQIITDGLAIELGFLLSEQSSQTHTIDAFIERLSQTNAYIPETIGLNESAHVPINDWLAATADSTSLASDMQPGLAYKAEDQFNANPMAYPLRNQQDFSENYVFPESYIDDTE